MKFFTRLLFCALAVLMVLSAVSCSKAEEDENIPEGFVKAETEGNFYSFYYPEGWILDRSDAGLTSVYVSDSDYSNITVTAMTFDPKYADLKQYAESYYIPQLAGNLKEFSPLKNEDESLKITALTIDECDAVSFEYTAQIYDAVSEESVVYRYRLWLISHDGYVYHVQYCAKISGDTDFFAAHEDEANTVAKSIRFH